MIRRWLTLMMVLALGAPGLARSSEALRQQSSRDWDARGLTRVEIENPSGDISVRPSRDGQVHLVALKTVRNPESQGATRLAEETRLMADLTSGVLKIGVRYPTRREIHINLWDLMRHFEFPEVAVQLAVELPPGLPLALRSASGDLQTSGVSGRQVLHSSSGDIEVEGAGASLSIETRSGDVTTETIAGGSVATSSGNVVIASSRGPLVVRSRSGDIRVDSATDSVTVESGSGEVRVGFARLGLDARSGSGDITARAGGAVHVESSSGEIKLALTSPLRRADIQSGSGDVVVRVAPAIECHIDAEAASGDVEIGLPLINRISREHQVIGRLGRGTSAIVIRTASGSINVAR